MYNKKYRLVSVEEFNRPNPLYLDVKDALCFLVYFNVGERGWFLYELSNDWFDMPHRIHTSVVQSVEYTDKQVVVVTENTRFVFELIEA